MAITFNTNLAALGAQRNIGIASNAASSSLSKLSSGSRVPQAKDDAAGLAIGSKLKSEVAGLTQASNNAAQAISLLQIADGALSTIGDVLQRMKALAVQSSSGQLDDSSRALLNQEFTGLNNEVSRVANLSNFNGTTLLAGSAEVVAKVNDIAVANGNTAPNLIGQGFEKIEFAANKGDGAIKIDYNATTRVMTVNDLATGKKQSITLDAAAIATGQTEELNFGDVGTKISLGANFNKATSIAGANTQKGDANALTTFTETAAITGLTGAAVAAGGADITALAFAGTGANKLSPSMLDGVTFNMSGAFGAVTVDPVVIGGHTFSTSVTFNTGTAGTAAYTFSDGASNTFTLSVTFTGTGTAGTAAGTVKVAQTGPSATIAGTGRIEVSGTGAAAPQLISVKQATASDTVVPFNFGNLDNTVISISAATANASVLSTYQNGVLFSSANTAGAGAGTSTGGSGTVDLTSIGTKTVTMADKDGNAMTVQFNVTTAFANGDQSSINMGQFGQVVGADSITTGNTSFDFKVGSGVTEDDSIAFTLRSATSDALGIAAADIGTSANANTAIGLVNNAITAVASRRADVGAAQSRLDFASNSISVAIENTTAAASALLDVDVSAEITKFTNQNVLMQAGISLLGQANQQPALLLRLLQ